jgi:Zn finger protein HypA/HybF involved in hydrogenase expression
MRIVRNSLRWQESSLKVKCPICDEEMEELSACHLRCDNCGSEMDCSDKGSVW